MRRVITDTAGAEKFGAVEGGFTRHVEGEQVPGWLAYDHDYQESPWFIPHGETHDNDPVLLYFTSGTTSKPKLVLHTQQSYPEEGPRSRR